MRLQQQFQPGEVRQLLVVTTSGLDKKLVQVGDGDAQGRGWWGRVGSGWARVGSPHPRAAAPPPCLPRAPQVYQRVQKHLGGSSPYLVEPVWEK